MSIRRNRSGLARRLFAFTVALAFILPDPKVSAQNGTFPGYRPARQVSGTIHICGSPQMAELFRRFQSGFASVQPKVRFEAKLESTLMAVSGVSSGHAEIGLLGRELWPAEAQAFAAVAGHPPLAIRIATGSYDVPKATFALMVFVPRANPIPALSLDQLERIFAASNSPVRTWGELGLKGTWADRPIHIYGFAKDNDKARIFRRLVFTREEGWSRALKEFANAPGPAGADSGELILRAVAGDLDGIGISNSHYATPAVKALPLARAAGGPPVNPTRETVAAGAYPLTRAIYMVVDPGIFAHPGGQSSNSTLVSEFLHYVLSPVGRRAVIEEGNYLPLTPAMARHELDKLRAQANE